MDLKLKLLIIFLLVFGCISAQDTTTILIYDSTTHTYKKVNLEEYKQRKLVRKMVTGQIQDEAKKVEEVETEKMYKINKKRGYLYNYGGKLKPVTALTFYYKISEDSLIPKDVDAQKWLDMSVRKQKRMLRKYSK